MPDNSLSSSSNVVQRWHWADVPFNDRSARVLVRHWGRDDQEPRKTLFALHGLTGTGMDFRYLATKLAATGWHVCAPDLPGHGGSKCDDPEAYSLDTLVRLFDGLVRRFTKAGEPACFIGSSMGSGLLATYLSVRPIRADAVILNDNAMQFHPYLLRSIEYLLNEPRLFATREDAAAQLVLRDRELFYQADNPRIASHVLGQLHNSRIEETSGGFRFNFDPILLDGVPYSKKLYPDFFSMISLIDASRIMLMFGEHSPCQSTKVTERLLQRRHIERCVVEDAGHPPRLLSEFDVDIVREFLERAPVPGD